MIGGAVLGVITMAFHPTGADQARLGVAVHALALFSVPLSFYGGWVLTRRLSAAGALAELGLGFYGLSAVAAAVAAAASGLIAPELFARAAGLEDQAAAAADAVIRYNHSVNQAFARILVATSSVAIAVWSVEIARSGLLRRGIGVFGCAAASLILLALFWGGLRMDVHGFGAVVLVQAIWLILVGSELRRSPSEAAAPAEP